MRQLRTAGFVIGMLALAGFATACGSVPASPAFGGARQAAATVGSAPAGAVPAAGSQAGSAGVTGGGVASAMSAKASVVAAKEHGAGLRAKPGAAVKHAVLLNGVSCVGAQCVAVGGWYYGPANAHTLVEVWTGKGWTLEPSPGGGPQYGALGAVSCAAGTPATPARCLAIGTPALAGYGSHWRVVTAPAALTAVSCTGADACLGVAGTATAHTPVFATWNGTTWRNGTMHAPPPQGTQVSVTIAGVSCASADSCVAVGNYSYPITAQPSPNFRDKTLAELWNGRSWRLLPTANVSHVNALTAVSCVSAGDCTAVGANQGQYPLAEHWNGSTWRVESMPTVSSIGYLQLTSVSCPAAHFCVAAGTYQVQAVAETWNGTKWRLTELPQPPQSPDSEYAELNSVSCASTRVCVAVGDSGNPQTFADVYTGGKWRLTATRNPT
jgi:hypothetical protein